MFALRHGEFRRAPGNRAGSLSTAGEQGGWLLPKWLRRPARILKRLNDGEIAVPRFAATAMTAIFLGATGVYGAILGGHMPDYAQAVTARTGFAVDEVRVIGHKETSEIDILDQLGLSGWTSLIGFNAETARERVATLPWVEVASVRKVYPDEIEVQIKEREPYALWQDAGQLSVIDKAGRVIAPFEGGHLSSLPLIIGTGAAAEATAFLETFAAHPDFASKVRAYIRVGERRWDVRLTNGMTVMLPENDVAKAAERFVDMQADGKLLSRDIKLIDMRLADRAVLRLTDDAMKIRTKDLEAAAKARKKAGKA